MSTYPNHWQDELNWERRHLGLDPLPTPALDPAYRQTRDRALRKIRRAFQIPQKFLLRRAVAPAFKANKHSYGR